MNELYYGIISGTVSIIICNPLDTIRTRIQVNKLSFNKLHSGIGIGIITVSPFWGIFFYSKKELNKYFSLPISSYFAGNIGSTICSPLYYIRQNIQVNNNFSFIEIYKKNGIKQFYTGIFETYLVNLSLFFQIPIYEKLKNENYNIIFSTIISKTIGSFLTYPFDTLRTIKRTSNNNITIIDFLQKPNIWYKGISVYLLKCLPYHCSIFYTYEFLKKKIN